MQGPPPTCPQVLSTRSGSLDVRSDLQIGNVPGLFQTRHLLVLFAKNFVLYGACRPQYNHISKKLQTKRAGDRVPRPETIYSMSLSIVTISDSLMIVAFRLGPLVRIMRCSVGSKPFLRTHSLTASNSPSMVGLRN